LSGLPAFTIVPDGARSSDLATRYWNALEELAEVSFS